MALLLASVIGVEIFLNVYTMGMYIQIV